MSAYESVSLLLRICMSLSLSNHWSPLSRSFPQFHSFIFSPSVYMLLRDTHLPINVNQYVYFINWSIFFLFFFTSFTCPFIHQLFSLLFFFLVMCSFFHSPWLLHSFPSPSLIHSLSSPLLHLLSPLALHYSLLWFFFSSSSFISFIASLIFSVSYPYSHFILLFIHHYFFRPISSFRLLNFPS